MFKLAIPVLHVSSVETARRFYCDQLGLTLRFAYRIDESKPDPCYMGVGRDRAFIHLSSFSGDAVVGGVVYLIVDDVNALHAELVERGMDVALEPTDQTWGNRELYINDPDGNSIRFVQEGVG